VFAVFALLFPACLQLVGIRKQPLDATIFGLSFLRIQRLIIDGDEPLDLAVFGLADVKELALTDFDLAFVKAPQGMVLQLRLDFMSQDIANKLFRRLRGFHGLRVVSGGRAFGEGLEPNGSDAGGDNAYEYPAEREPAMKPWSWHSTETLRRPPCKHDGRRWNKKRQYIRSSRTAMAML
jgi:hypothetical protein